MTTRLSPGETRAGLGADTGKTAIQLVMVLRRALGAPELTADDDFFERGGTSLAAAELFAFVERQLGLKLPLATLAEHPTMRRLAAYIEAREPRAAAPVSVVINTGEPGERPLFCVGGRGADAVVQIPLARRMGRYPFVALEYAGADGGPQRQETLAAIAARFVAEVRRVQPQGPYRLVGASFGGRVMFEVARGLRGAGEEIELLAMLDTYAPGGQRLRPDLGWRARIEAELIDVQMEHRHALALRPFVRGLKLAWFFRRTRRALAGGASITPEREHRWDVMQTILRDAGDRAAHASLDVRIELLRCREQRDPRHWLSEPELGWRGLALRGVGIHDIGGKHGDYWRRPVVDEVSAALRKLLDGHAP